MNRSKEQLRHFIVVIIYCSLYKSGFPIIWISTLISCNQLYKIMTGRSLDSIYVGPINEQSFRHFVDSFSIRSHGHYSGSLCWSIKWPPSLGCARYPKING